MKTLDEFRVLVETGKKPLKLTAQMKWNIAEAINRIHNDGISLGAGDFVDMNDLKYICQAASHLMLYAQQLEDENRHLRGASIGALITSGAEMAQQIDQMKEQIPRWISVEERLPEPKEDVALYIRCGDASFIRTGWRRGNGQFICPSDSLSGYEVTHWVPLPEPPKEVT